MTDHTTSSGGPADHRGEAIIGDPLITPPDLAATADAPVTTSATVGNAPVVDAPVVTPAPPTPVETDASGEGDTGGGKAKAAAVVAGAAALANKVRKEAPKAVHQLRERRAAGRCVVITEVDGRFLAIGPYKDEESARQDSFKVGGTPHVAELVSDSTFFAPTEQP